MIGENVNLYRPPGMSIVPADASPTALICSFVSPACRATSRIASPIRVAACSGICGECSQCLNHNEFDPIHGVCAFLVYTALAPGCSAWGLYKVDPELCALSWSKPLRFRFSGTPQGHRLVWACVLCPSPLGVGDGQGGLACCSPWGHKESDMTE